ncbi:MAG TPA: penicillin-binding protein activator [Candidatus Binatia bacterium]|nr:penicillin-binding protein activator [Candidatus Binatia bacterium]
MRSSLGIVVALVAAAGLAPVTPAHAQGGPIKIGLLSPVTGPLATPGRDMVDGFRLFWEQAGQKAGGRAIEIVVADTTCNPDQALTQARRLVHQEKVHFLVGPLCGHEGPAVAQVSRETGVPLVMEPAGADTVTKWDRTPTVVRTAVSASQIGHPWGDYMYRELGLRNVTFIGQDYTWGHEVTLGAVRTFTELGGKVARIIWNPIGTRDYGPTIAAIPADTDGVSAVVVGADRVRLFEAWFNFGMDKRHKIFGGYWMQQDVLPQMDDRAIGLIGNSLIYAAGLDTPENRTFTEAFSRKHRRLPSWFAESAYTAGLWTRAAIDAIEGKVEDREAFLRAMRTVRVNAPRGPVRMDAHDNPVQNVYVSKIQKINHPVLGAVLTNVPVKTYEAVSQFWTWTPEEFLKRGPYKR